MANDTDADFLFEIAFEGFEKLQIFLIAVFHFEGPDVAAATLEINFDGVGVAGVLHDALHVGIAPAGVNPELDVVEALHFAIERVHHEFHFVMILSEGVGHEVKGRLFDLNATAAGVAQGEELLVHGFGHVPDKLFLVVEIVIRRVTVEEESQHLGGARAELHGLP